MKKMRVHSLKQKIVFLFCCLAAVIVCFGMVYSILASRILIHSEEIAMKNIISQVTEQVEKSTTQTMNYAERVSKSVFTRQFLLADSLPERYEASRILYSVIPTLAESEDYSTNVSIVAADGSILGTPNKFFRVLDTVEQEYDALSKTVLKSGFTGRISKVREDTDYYAYYTPILDMSKVYDSPRKIGTCIVSSSLQSLYKSLKKLQLTPNSRVYLLDQSGNILLSNQDSSFDLDDQIALKEIALDDVNAKRVLIFGQKSLMSLQTASVTNWKILCIVPIAEIDSELRVMNRIILLFTIMALFGLLSLCLFESRKLLTPLAEISEFVSRPPTLEARLNWKERKDEIGILGNQIDRMLNQISELTHSIVDMQSRAYEAELARKSSILAMLRSQINPHFLYNTLDCIRGYGYKAQSPEIVQMCSSLTAIMRYSINSPEIVPLREELNCVRKYLTIIAIRFRNRFTTDVQIPEELEKVPVPSFILQPLVENAVYHGLEPKAGSGLLTISAHVTDGMDLVFRIYDNGVGISEKRLVQLQNLLEVNNMSPKDFSLDCGIGLLNVQRRIRTLYSASYGIALDSKEGEFTLVTVTLPYRQ